MPLSPVCLVNSGSTTNGVDVSPSSVVNITLLDPTTPGMTWFLEVIGTDELTSSPVLSNVNVLTHQVVSPGSTVSFSFPSAAGRAIGFKSRVTGTGGPIETTFGVYSLTAFTTRVGFVTETREGDSNYGWATKLNPLIRSGGGGGGAGGGFTLTLVDDLQTIPAKQSMLFEDHVIIEDGGNLVVDGDVTCVRTEDNFSVLLVPTRQERVVQENDELLFTDHMTIDGQLTVDGQICDATPYDGYDILNVLAEIGINPTGQAIWSNTISGSGTFVLELNKVNRYVSGPGMTLQFPAASHGAELSIKECSASAGTAPNVVTVDTNSGLINVEHIGLGGFTQTDGLTQFKTYLKYKYDTSASVWRILEAAYQLP